MILHPNAALRVLRRELLRLNDGRPELLLAAEDPRIPAGVALQQLTQTDIEIGQVLRGIEAVEAALEVEHGRAAA